ncbi:MAG: ribosome rescue protein RqcH [Methanobacterium sp.]|jgi:predicted ribosome quality control (RQC) complex YloA/Tae2 family protein
MKAMSNVDVYAICSELKKSLMDARFQKAYQPTKDTVLIRFHVPGEGRADVVFQAGLRVHLTHFPPLNPKMPPNFPMLLRKYLKGAIVSDVHQHHFDRIIEIEFQKEHKYKLIIELFSKGNIILLDEEGQIILPLKRKLWENRRISSKEEYKYPPERGINPLKVKKEDITELFTNSDTDIIRTLAKSGFGGLYAEEIVLRAEVPKKKQAAEVEENELNSIYQAMLQVFNPLKAEEFNPQIVTNSKNDVLPLNLQIYNDYQKKSFPSYNEAADEFYSSIVGEDIINVQESIWEAEVGKYEKRLRIQRETLEKFEKTVKESKIKGDLLYSNYQKVQNILDIINDARERYSWLEIIKIIKNGKKNKTDGLDIIESIDKLGSITLNLEDNRINIDSHLSIPENTEIYYNKGKKAKRKIKGVYIAIEKTLKEINKAKNKRDVALEQIIVPERRIKKELKWFEKLRWFLSSDGLLVIGGRDASTNETIVKHYLENNDIYLHSDIHGAPSVVIKSNGKEIPENTINEAAVMAASFSSAWSKGFGSQDVYWVNPEQVSKTPQSGEFVAKGAFIIRGARNYVRGVPLLIAVGIVDYEGERIMAGPTKALEKYTNNYVIIKPGYTKKEEISREILKRINKEHFLTLDDVIGVLPSGKCDFVNERDLKSLKYFNKQ